MTAPVLTQTMDFDGYRRALVAVAAMATGLPPSQVMMLQQERANAPRPAAPYVALMVTSASIKSGYDAQVPVADDPVAPTGNFNYTGPRSMSVSFEAFGQSHEQAYQVMAALQASLETPPVQALLDQVGLATYAVGAVADLSALLNTAWEGRAQMDVTFGMTSSLVLDAGRIDTVPDVAGLVTDAPGDQHIAINP